MSPITKGSIDTLARIVSAHVASMHLRKRLQDGGQSFFVADIKHINQTFPSGLKAENGNIFVPLNNQDATDDYTLLYEEYVGAVGWYKPMDQLDAKRKVREEALKAEIATLSSDEEKNKVALDDLKKRLTNHTKAREKYAQLANGTFPAPKGSTKAEMKKMFLLAQKRESLEYIEENHPDALPPFVLENTFAGIKAVGDLGVNLAMDFSAILRRKNGKYAFILGDRPGQEKIPFNQRVKATIGGMNEGDVTSGLLREFTEELSSRDLFAEDSPSRAAFLAMKPKVKELQEFLEKMIPEKDRNLYQLDEIFVNATKASTAEETTATGENALALLSGVIKTLEAIKEGPQAHAAHELAVKIKVEADKKYFAAENEKLKKDLLAPLEPQDVRAQVGDNRSGPCAVMRTVPFFGLFDEATLEKIMSGAYKTMCGGDDMTSPSVIDIDEVNYDLLFAEHAGILLEAVAWLYDKQSKTKEGVDKILLEQIQNIRIRNPKLDGILTLCETYQEKNANKVQGDLFLELSRDLKLLLAYQKLPQKGKLPNRDVSAAIETLNLYLFNRTLQMSNEDVAKLAKMDFNTAANQVIDAARELKQALRIEADEWPTRKVLKQTVKEVVGDEEIAELRQSVAAAKTEVLALKAGMEIQPTPQQQQQQPSSSYSYQRPNGNGTVNGGGSGRSESDQLLNKDKNTNNSSDDDTTCSFFSCFGSRK
jgi:hypothetical protein